MTESYDLIVIGTGQGGSGPATRCRKAGWRVVVIDDQPYGGTCALRGCDPKKVLVGASELMDWHRRMSASVVAPDARIDWPARPASTRITVWHVLRRRTSSSWATACSRRGTS